MPLFFSIFICSCIIFMCVCYFFYKPMHLLLTRHKHALHSLPVSERRILPAVFLSPKDQEKMWIILINLVALLHPQLSTKTARHAMRHLVDWHLYLSVSLKVSIKTLRLVCDLLFQFGLCILQWRNIVKSTILFQIELGRRSWIVVFSMMPGIALKNINFKKTLLAQLAQLFILVSYTCSITKYPIL